MKASTRVRFLASSGLVVLLDVVGARLARRTPRVGSGTPTAAVNVRHRVRPAMRSQVGDRPNSQRRSRSGRSGHGHLARQTRARIGHCRHSARRRSGPDVARCRPPCRAVVWPSWRRMSPLAPTSATAREATPGAARHEAEVNPGFTNTAQQCLKSSNTRTPATSPRCASPSAASIATG